MISLEFKNFIGYFDSLEGPLPTSVTDIGKDTIEQRSAYKGVTTTALTDGSTTASIQLDPGTGTTVSYTQQVGDIVKYIDSYFEWIHPTGDNASWRLISIQIGNYILIGQDYTATQDTSDIASVPSTMYVVENIDGSAVTWGGPIRLTGGVPLAQEDLVGGFYNVPEDLLGGGYVWRDNAGNLRLLDFDLLKTGVLAYRLGTDQHISGSDVEDINQQLMDIVNERVAFPSSYTNGGTRVVNVYVTVPESYDAQTPIVVRDVDSRYNTCLYLHILKEDSTAVTSNLVIQIENCERIRLDIGEGCESATYELFNSSIYYDADILDKLTTISGMSLWYERFSDTDQQLMVEDMTVSYIGPMSGSELSAVDPFTEDTPNDNHYAWLLKSITFSPNGDVEGLGLMVQDQSTNNVVTDGTFLIYAPFTTLSNGELTCPPSKILRNIVISGNFTSAYLDGTATPPAYILNEVSVSATPKVASSQIEGQIAIKSTVRVCSNISGTGELTAMQPDTWHYIEGRASS